MKRGIIICLLFVLLISFASAQITTDCSNVVGLWHFDVNADDDSWNGNDGDCVSWSLQFNYKYIRIRTGI